MVILKFSKVIFSKTILLILFVALVFILAACPNGIKTPMGDDNTVIDYGSGTSTILFDFDDSDDISDIEYEFEWKDKTTGADLLKAVGEDYSPALYLNISGGMLYGATLDIDGDNDAPNWGTNPDKPSYIDSGDIYRYGWFGTVKGNPEFNGSWNYYIGKNESETAFSQLGIISRVLTDGSVDKWIFKEFN